MDQTTLIIIGVIVGISSLFFVYMIACYILGRKTIKWIKSEQPISRDAEYITSRFKQYYDDIKLYQKSFIIQEKKTTVPAYDYFHENVIFGKAAKGVHTFFDVYQIGRVIPNMLVGIGIFGTFLGLTLGIRHFGTESVEAITSSINLLLSGINTAFQTSLFGIFFSVVITVSFNLFLKLTKNDTFSLCAEIDDQYYVDPDKFLGSIMIGSDPENGENLYPRLLLQKIAEDSREQKLALQSFSTDLADQMKNISEQMITNYNDNMYDMYQNILEPALNEVKRGTEALIQEKSRSSEEVIQKVITDLQDSLETLIGDFKESVSGDTKQEMEYLAGTVAKAGSSFEEIPLLLEDTLGKIKESQDQQTTIVNELVERFQEIVGSFSREMEKGQRMAISLVSAEEKLIDAGNILNRMMETGDFSINEMKDSTQKLVEATSSLGELSKAVSERATFVIQENESINNNFLQIDSSLEGVFEKLHTGLTQYRNAVNEGLENNLATYSSSIEKYAHRLASAVDSLTEQVEEFQEVISERNREKEVIGEY